jgi:hypothetical protein
MYDLASAFFIFIGGVILGAASPLPPGITWWEVAGIVQFPLLCGIIAHLEGMRLREFERSLKG